MKPYAAVSVGVDLSPASDGALSQAIRLASWSGTAPSVVHVIDTRVVEDAQHMVGDRARIAETLTEDARKRWSTSAGSVAGASALPLTVVVDDRAAGLVHHAKSAGSDLLILGAPAIGPAETGAGTMTAAAVRHAPCDVLVARETARGPFRTVVACTDFSEASRGALERAADIAARDGAALRVLHVYAEPTRLYPTLSAVVKMWVDAALDFRGLMKQRLESFAAQAVPPAGAIKPTTHVVEAVGHGKAIVAFANELKADLVVLGTRGRSTLRDLLLGSTAERVLRDSACSVLAVRPRGAR